MTWPGWIWASLTLEGVAIGIGIGLGIGLVDAVVVFGRWVVIQWRARS